MGPIGPLLMGESAEGATPLYIYSYSEVVVLDHLSDRDQWTRSDVTIAPSGNHRFPAGSVRGVQLSAWLCSASTYDAEQAGWGVDAWDANVTTGQDGDEIEVRLTVAVGPRGSRLNRVGYSWTAYVAG
jgi:hypothetical protein